MACLAAFPEGEIGKTAPALAVSRLGVSLVGERLGQGLLASRLEIAGPRTMSSMS